MTLIVMGPDSLYKDDVGEEDKEKRIPSSLKLQKEEEPEKLLLGQVQGSLPVQEKDTETVPLPTPEADA